MCTLFEDSCTDILEVVDEFSSIAKEKGLFSKRTESETTKLAICWRD